MTREDTQEMKRALVTGAPGFLGSAIARALLRRGVAVRGLALPGEDTENLDGLDIEIVRGDVLRRADVERAVQGCDTVFHAAAIYLAWAPDPTRMYEVNIRGTFNVLEASRRADVARVVYTASISALGRPMPGELADEETPYEAWDIDFPYSRSKYLSLITARDFARWDVDVRMVCPGLLIGPRDIRPTPSGMLIVNILGGKVPGYFDGGATYLDVRDAAEVHLLAAERGAPGEIYVATAHNLSNRKFIEQVADVAGISVPNIKVPLALGRVITTGFEAWARKTGGEPLLPRDFLEYSLRPAYFDNSKSIEALGATYRPFEETVGDAIEYFRQRGLIEA